MSSHDPVERPVTRSPQTRPSSAERARRAPVSSFADNATELVEESPRGVLGPALCKRLASRQPPAASRLPRRLHPRGVIPQDQHSNRSLLSIGVTAGHGRAEAEALRHLADRDGTCRSITRESEAYRWSRSERCSTFGSSRLPSSVGDGAP